MPIDKNGKRWVGPSKSDSYLENRSIVPQVSALMANSVSQERRVLLANEVDKGLFRDGSAVPDKYGPTNNSIVTASIGIKKTAQALSSGGFRGSGDTVKQAPEVYSPLWLNSNLSLPRDRATINAWCRSFYALNPFVQNAINLHSTYPISKLNIKSHNKEVENFFNEMIEEIDLMNICVQVAQEYWLLGEAFPYAEMDNNKGKWSRLLIQNPDYMIVQRTVVADEPLIMLRPDENLKKIIFSNKPSDIEQRKQLNQHIIDSVKRGNNIPLDNFHVSHLARRISPYEIRGTGLPVSIFRNLMLFDKLRESKFAQADSMINPLTLVKIGSEGPDGLHPTFADIEAWREVFECHDEETEVLTEDGFKKYHEVIDYVEIMDGTYNYPVCYAIPKQNVKIACFNPNNEQLEYHKPLSASLYNYDGEMYHYLNKKIDIKVTPNHDLWVSEKTYQYNGHRSLRKTIWSEWKKVKAKDIKFNEYKKIRSQLNWTGEEITSVTVLDKEIPIELYLEFLGYLLSEGCLYSNGSQFLTGISQKKYKEEMQESINKFASYFNKKVYNNDRKNDIWNGSIHYKDLYFYFKKEVGDDLGNTKAPSKKIPQWIKKLSPRLLKILLDAMVKGDGSIKKKANHSEFFYYTTSKQLADDVYEIVYKISQVPILSIKNDNRPLISKNNRFPIYAISWSTTNNGNFPLLYGHSTNPRTKEKKSSFKIEKYNGKVWCFEVPTGLFVTRRNGKITIQGNSAQNDKDFKIFTHPGVTIEKIGSGSGIYDISGDITQLMKEIFIGLQIPQVLMDGADITYANGGVAMDALRQRYISFRNMLSAWLRRKIFAPISKMQEFYEYSNGEKKLIVPEVDWNHMSLFDTGDYITNLVTLTQGEGDQKRVSLHTLYRSIGLEYEDEVRKMRKEAIQNAIAAKEKEALQAMDLNALRSLDDDDEIIAPENAEGGGSKESPLPGETPGGSSLPGLDLGSLSGGGSSPSVPATSPEASAGTPPKT